MTSPDSSGELQFDSVVPRADQSAAFPAGTSCTLCQRPIAAEYYDVNGHTTCHVCCAQVAHQAEVPREIGTLLRAAVTGAVAAVLGAVVYFAVLAISGFEVGLVAIAIGYMVGYGVRFGTRGRGGRRFQVLALVLTYWAVGLAYSSLAIKELIDNRSKLASAAISGSQAAGPAQTATAEVPADDTAIDGAQFAIGLAVLLAFTWALPVVVIAGSMPGGVLSAAIIGFGMLQAWKMTAAPAVVVSGPYRIGATAAG